LNIILILISLVYSFKNILINIFSVKKITLTSSFVCDQRDDIYNYKAGKFEKSEVVPWLISTETLIPFCGCIVRLLVYKQWQWQLWTFLY